MPTPATTPEVLIPDHRIHGDTRRSFAESYNERNLAEAPGVSAKFVKDSSSRSMKGVLRGLHCQLPSGSDEE